MQFNALREAAGVVATLGLLAATWLPQEHVHVSRARQIHHSDVVHRHYAPHHQDTGTALNHGEGEIEWLTAPYTRPRVPAPTHPVLQLLDVPVVVDAQPATPRIPVRIIRFSVHDPPWLPASGLRAPPIPFLT